MLADAGQKRFSKMRPQKGLRSKRLRRDSSSSNSLSRRKRKRSNSSPSTSSSRRKRKRRDSSPSTSSPSKKQKRRKSDYILKEFPYKKYGKSENCELIDISQKSAPSTSFAEDVTDKMNNTSMLVIKGELEHIQITEILKCIYKDQDKSSNRRIACIQPTVDSVVTMAKYVADEMNANNQGPSVRYKVLVTDETDSPDITIMTDFILMKEIHYNRKLDNYDILIINTVDKRTLYTDILIGHIKNMTQSDTDLKIIISCSEPNATKISDFLGNIPIITPYEYLRFDDILYTEALDDDYLKRCIISVLKIHKEQSEGNVAVYLTNQKEIQKFCKLLKIHNHTLESNDDKFEFNLRNNSRKILTITFEPSKNRNKPRKIFLVTHEVETSLINDDVCYVIDPRYVEESDFNPITKSTERKCFKMSHPAAFQKIKCLEPVGKCRSHLSFVYKKKFPKITEPEIKRSNLEEDLLIRKELSRNGSQCKYFEHPAQEAISFAQKKLQNLGALDEHGEITKLGTYICSLHVNLKTYKMLLASKYYRCTADIVAIVAMLSVKKSIFIRPSSGGYFSWNASPLKKLIHPSGDHLTLRNIYNAWADKGFSKKWCSSNKIDYESMLLAKDVYQHLASLTEREFNTELVSSHKGVNIYKSIIAGDSYNIAKIEESGDYRVPGGNTDAMIHPESVLFNSHPECLVYDELTPSTVDCMVHCTKINYKWVLEANILLIEVASIDRTNVNTNSKTVRKTTLNKCSVCGKAADMLFLPCGHMVCCSGCGIRYKRCADCKEKIVSYNKISECALDPSTIECYPINKNEMGHFLIFNHENFLNRPDSFREGSSNDVKELEVIFKGCGFMVHTYTDLSKADILKIIKEFAKKQGSVYVVCILSHGVNDKIVTSDDQQLSVELVKSSMHSINYTRPKILIIQACRSKDKQKEKRVKKKKVKKKFKPDRKSNAKISKKLSDFVTFWATSANQSAKASKSNGSYFIQTLCSCLKEAEDYNDILEVFGKVVNKLKIRYKDNYQVPEIRSTLTKKIYLKGF